MTKESLEGILFFEKKSVRHIRATELLKWKTLTEVLW